MSHEEATCPTSRGQERPFFHGPTTGGDVLFPLGYLPVPSVDGSGVQRRRARRQAARIREANEAIFGLNFLAGYGTSHREQAAGVGNSLQVAAVDDILGRVDEGGFDQCSGEGSLREILRGRAGYDSDTTAQGSLAPYQPTLLAVPGDVSQAPFARDIVGPGARSFLDGIKRMLRPDEQVKLLDSLHGAIVSYVDPVLKNSRRHYVGFVKRLFDIKLAVVCPEPAESVGIFFVYKKGRKGIRLILDARRTNRRFASAPSVSLLTTEGLCGAEVVGGDPDEASGTTMAFAVGDIKDAFHHMRIDDDLGRWFTFPYRLTAAELGMSGHVVGGRRLRA